MDTDLAHSTLYCHWCEQITDQVDRGERTHVRTAGGEAAVELSWRICSVCGAENLS